MKKKNILLLLALLLGMGNAWADNNLSAKDVIIAQEGTAVLAIEANLEKDDFIGYQLDITLPKGLSLATNTSEKVVATSYTELDIDGTALSTTETTTTYRLLAAKMGNPKIPSGTYVLLSVNIESDGTLNVGDLCQCSITNIKFSDSNQQKKEMEDANFSVTISDRVVLDENSPVAPAEQSGVNVLVKRTIKAGQWNTIVLPFTLKKLQAETAFGSDVQLAEFSGFEVDYGDDDENVVPLGLVINLSTYTLTSRKHMTGGKPFFIKVSKDIESFIVDNVDISSNVNDVSKSDEYGTQGILTGTLKKSIIPEDGLFISDGQFWYSVGKTNVKAFRCWFQLDAVLDKATDFASRISLNILDENETTGIHTIVENSQLNDRVYDILGRRMAPSKLKKGLYIMDGKKVIINKREGGIHTHEKKI